MPSEMAQSRVPLFPPFVYALDSERKMYQRRFRDWGGAVFVPMHKITSLSQISNANKENLWSLARDLKREQPEHYGSLVVAEDAKAFCKGHLRQFVDLAYREFSQLQQDSHRAVTQVYAQGKPRIPNPSTVTLPPSGERRMEKDDTGPLTRSKKRKAETVSSSARKAMPGAAEAPIGGEEDEEEDEEATADNKGNGQRQESRGARQRKTKKGKGPMRKMSVRLRSQSSSGEKSTSVCDEAGTQAPKELKKYGSPVGIQAAVGRWWKTIGSQQASLPQWLFMKHGFCTVQSMSAEEVKNVERPLYTAKGFGTLFSFQKGRASVGYSSKRQILYLDKTEAVAEYVRVQLENLGLLQVVGSATPRTIDTCAALRSYAGCQLQGFHGDLDPFFRWKERFAVLTLTAGLKGAEMDVYPGCFNCAVNASGVAVRVKLAAGQTLVMNGLMRHRGGAYNAISYRWFMSFLVEGLGAAGDGSFQMEHFDEKENPEVVDNENWLSQTQSIAEWKAQSAMH